ncbi:MAG: hypothetical protein ACRCYQ_02320 [Nocardioides sp.]
MTERDVCMNTGLLRMLAEECGQNRDDITLARQETTAVRLTAAAVGDLPEAQGFLSQWVSCQAAHDLGLGELADLTARDGEALGHVATGFDAADEACATGFVGVGKSAEQAASAASAVYGSAG